MFENIRNFADLKKAYHKAARENHPDLGGDTETMKKINNDFDRAAKLEEIAPQIDAIRARLEELEHMKKTIIGGIPYDLRDIYGIH